MDKLNKITIDFIDELKLDPNIVGIILFGSWARGNNRADSDVDLMIIQKEGFRRAVEKRDDQIFEIIYLTEDSALDYWKSHLNDAASLWEVAKILFDREGNLENLRNKVNVILSKGKPQIDSFQKEQFRFDAEDQIAYVEFIKESDLTTANLILNSKVIDLTAKYFDLRGLFTPAPKQRLQKIKELDLMLFTHIKQFYAENNIEQKIKIAKDIVKEVFI